MEAGKGSLRAVILLLGAVLVVGSLVPLAEADPTAAATGAADAKFCCKDKIGSHCYAACTTQYGPTPFCAEMCCCVQLTSGRCPRQCPTPADPRLFLANSSTFDLLTTNAVEVESCTLRCSSIVCDSMRNGKQHQLSMSAAWGRQPSWSAAAMHAAASVPGPAALHPLMLNNTTTYQSSMHIMHVRAHACVRMHVLAATTY
ncbi:viscotoxin-A3-like isoform X1 [Triticum dicoccoides]|uniref:viscotoxin-A3-like isoform X1 n=1 Tax=Triticum dicoccoides TaxID=85692 RepID=UPI00189090E7|nr:viscotoxin-A3-like isoform X1 [Triticum dicoccoides]